MIDLNGLVRAGDGVWWSQAGAEATPLVDGLLDQVAGIGAVRASCGVTVNPRMRALPGDVGLVQVAPPGPDGRCSFGIGADYAADVTPAPDSVNV